MSKALSGEMVEICRSLWMRNMLAGADGNISCRCEDGKLLITPSGRVKSRLNVKDILAMDISGESLSKGHVSSEKEMHLAVYRHCLKAKAVIHAHPPFAVAWSVARPRQKFLPTNVLSEVILACGDIPIVPFAFPGTAKLGEALVDFLPEYRIMILARHGALSWGESLEEAWRGMERLEHAAEILYRAEQLGGVTFLSDEEERILREMRQKKGDTSY